MADGSVPTFSARKGWPGRRRRHGWPSGASCSGAWPRSPGRSPCSPPERMSAKAMVAVSALAIVFLFAPRAAVAQRFHAEGRVPPRFPPEGLFDRGVTFCRLMYESDRREAGGIGWITDYPYAEINFLTRVSELTTTGVNFEKSDLPNYYVVRPTDKALFNCPFVMATD